MIDWRRIVTPTAWVQLGKVDWAYDKALNAALDEHGVEKLTEYQCKVGKQMLWTQNYPYAYGYPYDQPLDSDYTLPSCSTRARLRKMLQEVSSSNMEF